MKCGNGPAFRVCATKRVLLDSDISTFRSPPYCVWYNGACERANRTLKELTAHLADQAGRTGFWMSDDLLAARVRANRLSRSWGALGPTPEESWATPGVLSLDEREVMWQHLKSGIAEVLNQREIDPTATLPHYTQSEIKRASRRNPSFKSSPPPGLGQSPAPCCEPEPAKSSAAIGTVPISTSRHAGDRSAGRTSRATFRR